MKTIAVVDDEKNILTSLKMAFEAEGFDVRVFQDPVAALPKLIFEPPHLLILNGRMPEMHGIEFFKKFRTFSRAPVIILSASAEEISQQLDRIGLHANDYVDKPFSQRQVVSLSKRLLRGRESRQVPANSSRPQT
jgi:two-component system response regulator ChvI